MTTVLPGLQERVALTDHEFVQIRELMRKVAAVTLSPHMKTQVACRLQQRLRRLEMSHFREYLDYISHHDNTPELQRAVDLLTTHETYFFREPAQFEVFMREILPSLDATAPLRFWSAAASSGEEAYSIAMAAMATLGEGCNWEVLGSDISADVLARARAAVYRHERLERMPADYLRRYCLRGIGADAGSIRIDDRLRRRVRFQQMNLAALPPAFKSFDVVFLRNVLFYFDAPTRRLVLEGVIRQLKPGGWLLVGHAEGTGAVQFGLRQHRPGVYRLDGEAT